ncbi:MAG: iron-containing alcohol dehydrogenase family protein, partial [Clostridiales bacterium]|nr:iron-containing alcohol dehydrogenase family protein [Clostridiales bacterium]
MEEKHGSICLPAWTAGKDIYEDLPEIAEKFGKRVFLIGGVKALQAGQQKLIEAIAGSNLLIVSAHNFTGICSMAQAQDLAEEAVLNSSDIVFGMGGG